MKCASTHGTPCQSLTKKSSRMMSARDSSRHACQSEASGYFGEVGFRPRLGERVGRARGELRYDCCCDATDVAIASSLE